MHSDALTGHLVTGCKLPPSVELSFCISYEKGCTALSGGLAQAGGHGIADASLSDNSWLEVDAYEL